MLNPHRVNDEGIALGLVLRHLTGSGYRFITPTPLTHGRVLALRGAQTASTLRDVFGCNLPFTIATCDGMNRELLAAMRGAGVLRTNGDELQSRVRVASGRRSATRIPSQGANLGRALSVRIGEEALGLLAPGGRLLLYAGVAIVNGVDAFLADMQPVLAIGAFDWSYSEIDPDVFGEELEQPVYAHIDRIAAVGLTVTRRLAL